MTGASGRRTNIAGRGAPVLHHCHRAPPEPEITWKVSQFPVKYFVVGTGLFEENVTAGIEATLSASGRGAGAEA